MSEPADDFSDIRLAVIGGSGFYTMPGLEEIQEVRIETPYGLPSAPIISGKLLDQRIVFLARHGENHQLLPSEIPQQANIWALKSIGVERIIAVSAVGSLRKDYNPKDLVVPDQLIDRTSGNRPATFFGNGIVAHVSMAEPFCKVLREDLIEAITTAQENSHNAGTYICIEGPTFGTIAESHLFQKWGASIVGMTGLPEAKLAREAESCYGMLAMVTDYDCWQEGQQPVEANTVAKVLVSNVKKSQKVVNELVLQPYKPRNCSCKNSLDNALITNINSINPETKKRLLPLLKNKDGDK